MALHGSFGLEASNELAAERIVRGAVFLFGDATGDKNLLGLGRILRAVESTSVQRYYHIRKNSDIYPAPFRDRMVAGVLWSDKAEYTTFYDNLGGGWRWHGWGTGMATTTVENIPVGTLVVDIYDCSSRNLVWRGLANDQLSDKPDKDTKKLEKAVAKMFAKFPPSLAG